MHAMLLLVGSKWVCFLMHVDLHTFLLHNELRHFGMLSLYMLACMLTCYMLRLTIPALTFILFTTSVIPLPEMCNNGKRNHENQLYACSTLAQGNYFHFFPNHIQKKKKLYMLFKCK